MLAPHIEESATAQSKEPAQQTQAAAPSTTAGQKIITAQPSLTTGTVGIYLVLAHHIQSDELVVNGYDMLKLQNAELQMLSRLIPSNDIQKAVNDARASEVFTLPPQQTSAPTQPPNKPPGK